MSKVREHTPFRCRCCLSVYRTLLERMCRSVVVCARRIMNRSLRGVALETIGIPGGMVAILGEVLDETLPAWGIACTLLLISTKCGRCGLD
jgi:hypothetical protein